ncbi:MAG TPA: threonine/serine dehydratase [Anaerolineae bacterium]|nr:threonine/serine dehydratase [Anaerolineae bacterium]
MTELALGDIVAARQRLGSHVWRTPLLPSEELGRRAGAQVYLKLECWQHTGSFKVRGALSKLASLEPEECARGVVTASAGNHGLGVAYAAKALGLAPATIFLPEVATETKVRHLVAMHCHLRRAGADYDAAHAQAARYANAQGALYLSAYDDLAVIAGQGTVALEVLEELPDADLLLVPIGGGGLVAGVAVAARALRPGIRIIGVQPEASPAAYLSLRDGRPYETFPAESTICDGLAGGFGRMPFEVAGRLIDDVLPVPESAVRHAVAWLATHEQLLVEGSGAIAIAPLLAGKALSPGRRAVAILTGRNIDSLLLRQCLEEFDDA